MARSSTTARTSNATRIGKNFKESSLPLLLKDEEEDNDRDFSRLLITYCHKYKCEEKIFVQNSLKDDSYLCNLQTRSVMKSTTSPIVEMGSSLQEEQEVEPFDPNVVIINAIYDSEDALVEISVVNVRRFTVKPLQVILLLAPKYHNLTKLSIIRTGIDVYIINVLNNMLCKTFITEIFLKELMLSEGNYAILLGPTTSLLSLTISNCKVNDKVCEQIAYRLHHTSTAGKTLVTLDLSFNNITDHGAKYLANALRTNRRLRSLNLASNRITDQGASFIFNILNEFPLTAEEIVEIRRKKFRLLWTHKPQLQNIPVNLKPKQTKDRAASVNKNVGISTIQDDPFADENLYFGDRTYCNGNHVLCYLNLAYNELTFKSIKTLSDVLDNQCKLMRICDIGLIRLVVEGNNISAVSPEMTKILYFLGNNSSRLFTKRNCSLLRPKRLSQRSDRDPVAF